MARSHSVCDLQADLSDATEGAARPRRRWLRRIVKLVLALILLVLLGVGALLYRLSQGPLSLDFLTAAVVRALEPADGSFTVSVGATELVWTDRWYDVDLRVRDVAPGGRTAARAIVMQKKTHHPVKFEITEQTRDAIGAWLGEAQLGSEDFLFPSRVAASPHLSTRQYARILKTWVTSIGLDAAGYGTHSMRRTKPTLIYRRTRNLRAVQLLLGHTKLESTVRYLGIEVDDALEIAEQTDA